MRIEGTVTRVVEKNERAGENANRVFMRPDDVSSLRELDGSDRAGHSEIAVVVDDKSIGAFKVGAPCAYDAAKKSIVAAAARAPADAA